VVAGDAPWRAQAGPARALLFFFINGRNGNALRMALLFAHGKKPG
jgi:hypothetical protein